jgi:hypothetical protein
MTDFDRDSSSETLRPQTVATQAEDPAEDLDPVTAPIRPRPARKATATHVRPAAGDADRSLATSSLDLYIRSIRHIPVLSREETYELARGLEAEEALFRQAVASLPAVAEGVIARWHERQSAGRVTAPSARYRETLSSAGRALDTQIAEVERLLEERKTGLLAAGARRAGHAPEREIGETPMRADVRCPC